MNKGQVLKRLREADEAYYGGDTPTMSDQEYDKLLEYAQSQGWIEDVEVSGQATLKGASYTHTPPMLSLDKAKNKEEVESFAKKCLSFSPNTTFIVEPKMDGLALSIHYNKGKVVHIITRGDGRKGEYLDYLINHSEITIENMVDPFGDFTGELRGELFIKKSELPKLNHARGEDFKNERNAVAGVVKRGEKGLGYQATISFVPYSIVKEGVFVDPSDSLYLPLKPSSSIWGDTLYANLDTLLKAILGPVKEALDKLDYPTDGVVIKPSDFSLLELMGNTSHHPNAHMAFKYPGDERPTRLIEVYFSVGKTGRITPQGLVEPVTVSGTTITRVTLHNQEWAEDMGIMEDSIVLITRANDVIPAVTQVIDTQNAKPVKWPTACPECSTPLAGNKKSLYCPNEECPSRKQHLLRVAVSRDYLDIEGMSDAVLEALEGRVYDLPSLVSVPREVLVSLVLPSGVSLGEKRGDGIYKIIQERKKTAEPYRWLASFGVKGLGKRASQLLLKHYKSIPAIFEAEDLETISGIGPIMAEEIKQSATKVLGIYNKLKDLGVVFSDISSGEVKQKGSFSTTGSAPPEFGSRNAWVDYMATRGWEFHSSPKATTKYFITEGPSTSAKAKKAASLGLTVVSWEEFLGLGLLADDEEVQEVSSELLEQNKEAYRELAK